MNVFANMLNNLKHLKTNIDSIWPKTSIANYNEDSERLPKTIRGIQNWKIVDDRIPEISEGLGILNFFSKGDFFLWLLGKSIQSRFVNAKKIPNIWIVACFLGNFSKTTNCFQIRVPQVLKNKLEMCSIYWTHYTTQLLKVLP